MLSPDERGLYTDALTPPAGYVFDQAVATTYSLDPATLLSVPVHLALLGRRRGEGDVVALLEALRRVADRTTVYAQRGRMQTPRGQHVLYGLLESMVIEVAAPKGGAFHPKLWALRFVEPDSGDALLRLLVLSRNLTADRSWDLCLTLEGGTRRRRQGANRDLARLIRSLPSFALNTVPRERREQADLMADEVHRADWVPPERFESVEFIVIGQKKTPWRPPRSKRLAVISPFVTDEALELLAGAAREPAVLISRPESLAELSEDPGELFDAIYTLDEAAESEDGEDTPERDMLGLHAKAMVMERGWDTRLYMGSANATTAAIAAEVNTELMAVLSGKTSQVGGIDDLLGEGGLQDYLFPFVWEEAEAAPEDAGRLAEAALEKARRTLAETKMFVSCGPDEEKWKLTLQSPRKLRLDGVAAIRAWPITVKDELGRTLGDFSTSRKAVLGSFALASVTGLIAFELSSEIPDVKLRFALNLPLKNAPAERDAAILRIVLDNQAGFLRYLLLLLGDFIDEVAAPPFDGGLGTSWAWSRGETDELPLLEEMARAFSRDPDRLHEVRRLIERLASSDEGADVVPEKFLELWKVFERALSEDQR